MIKIKLKFALFLFDVTPFFPNCNQTFKEKKGTKILKIFMDEEPISPREWDNFGTMVLKHSRYDFVNEINLNFNDFNSLEEIKNHLKEEHKAEVVLLVSLYDHSGVSLSTSENYPFNDCWDSSKIGFIFEVIFL